MSRTAEGQIEIPVRAMLQRRFHINPISGVQINVSMIGDEKPVWTIPDQIYLFGIHYTGRWKAKALLTIFIDEEWIHTRLRQETKDELRRDRLKARGWHVEAVPCKGPTSRQVKMVTRRIVELVQAYAGKYSLTPKEITSTREALTKGTQHAQIAEIIKNSEEAHLK